MIRMAHGDFKIGERCQRAGAYRCMTCRQAGKDTRIELAERAVFPFCAGCKERGAEEPDVLWKKAS
jgi:hypothetical protein